MAFRCPEPVRALMFGSSIGLVALSVGCDGGSAPPSGTQVQDPPPIRAGAESARPEQPPEAADSATKAPATKAP